MRIVLMGPPGAGKGTQAQRLARRFDLAHLSSGDLFRAEKAAGSPLGQRLAGYMDAGQLVPDDLVVEMMAQAIAAGGANGGVLLDGFPRTPAQARALDAELDKTGAALDAVVVIQADEKEIINRITGRRSCPRCGRVYHDRNLRPRRDNLCDDCGEPLTQRDDDTEAVVRRRMTAYREATEPVIAYYRGRSAPRVIDIDGNRSPDEVTTAIVAAVAPPRERT